MIKSSIQVVNKLGLHARAATKLVNLATSYESTIHLVKDGQQTDAKGIMGIMMLAASQGSELELVVDGADEELAMNSLVELFQQRFGEEE